MTRQLTELEKMFTNHLFYKGLLHRIYEELLQLKITKIMKNWERT